MSDNDYSDAYLGKLLKHWLGRRRAAANGRARLLWAAAEIAHRPAHRADWRWLDYQYTHRPADNFLIVYTWSFLNNSFHSSLSGPYLMI